MKQLLWSIAVTFGLSVNALAVDIEVGVSGVVGGDRGESREVRQDYERLEGDMRSIRMAQRHVERLSRQEVPEKLDEQAQEEWRRQSEWLKKRAETLDDIADEMDEYLGEWSAGARNFGFDYQRITMETRLILSRMKDQAENYPVNGNAAVQRQKKAVKAIAHAD